MQKLDIPTLSPESSLAPVQALSIKPTRPPRPGQTTELQTSLRFDGPLSLSAIHEGIFQRHFPTWSTLTALDRHPKNHLELFRTNHSRLAGIATALHFNMAEQPSPQAKNVIGSIEEAREAQGELLARLENDDMIAFSATRLFRAIQHAHRAQVPYSWENQAPYDAYLQRVDGVFDNLHVARTRSDLFEITLARAQVFPTNPDHQHDLDIARNILHHPPQDEIHAALSH